MWFYLLVLSLLLAGGRCEEEYYNIEEDFYEDLPCLHKQVKENFIFTSNCDGVKVHGDGKKIIMDNNVEFRKAVVESFNNFRDNVSAGHVDKLPSAKMMRLVNYNVQLEFVAYCILANLSTKADFQGKPERCIRSEGSSVLVDMLYGTNEDIDMSDVGAAINFLDNQFEETIVKKVTNAKGQIADSYSQKVFGHFGIALNEKLNSVGCVRMKWTNPPKDVPQNIMACIVDQCWLGLSRMLMSNPNYAAGEPCNCYPTDNNKKCTSTRYQFLCGDEQEVPTYGWKKGPIPEGREYEKNDGSGGSDSGGGGGGSGGDGGSSSSTSSGGNRIIIAVVCLLIFFVR